MRRPANRRIALTILSGWGLASLVGVLAAGAQSPPRPMRQSSVRPATQQAPRAARSGYRGHGSYQRQGRYQGSRQAQRHPPRFGDYYRYRASGALGSASNVRSGFYDRFTAPRHRVHAPGYVVYVSPPADYMATPRTAEEPQPIVIVNQVPAQPAAPPPPPPPVYVPPPPPPPDPGPRVPTEVWITVAQEDAVVYLDDERLGSGRAISSLSEPLALLPGVYVIEVEHPELSAQRLVFGVRGGEPVRIDFDLAAVRASRQARVR